MSKDLNFIKQGIKKANKYEKVSNFISHQVNVFENQKELQQCSQISGLSLKKKKLTTPSVGEGVEQQKPHWEWRWYVTLGSCWTLSIRNKHCLLSDPAILLLEPKCVCTCPKRHVHHGAVFY